MVVSVIYAVALAILICWLAFKVIAVRRDSGVLNADGGNKSLQIARSAHSNATEYIPIMLILLFGLEFNNGHSVLVHALGVSCIVARYFHAQAVLKENVKQRVIGMVMTFNIIFILCALNIAYLVWPILF